MSEAKGVFTLSLDTELAWGCFDTAGVAAYKSAYERTPAVIEQLCSLFDEYDIPATWALVSHLLDDCTTDSEPHRDIEAPSFDWIADWFEEVPCAGEWPKDIWYAPDLVNRINDCNVDHEIGLHGYTHVILGADGCSQTVANDEVSTAVSVARSNGVDPISYVFPRNEVGHEEVLSEYGIEAFRGPTDRPFVPSSVPELFRKPLRYLVEATTVTPRTVVPRTDGDLVEIPSSQVFRPSSGGWQYTPRRSQYRRAKKGMERAAETGQIFHLWFHPFNITIDREFLLHELERILQMAAQLREKGRLEVMTMQTVTREYLEGRWGGTER